MGVDGRTSVGERAVRVPALIILGGFAVAAVVVAFAWTQLAHPAQFTVVAHGASMGEDAAAHQFGVEVTYGILAGVFGLVLGAVAGWRWHRLGWPLVAWVAICAIAAALLSWRLGVALGPPNPRSQLAGSHPGDLIPMQLTLLSHGLLLIWPIAALVGLIGSVSLVGEHDSAVPEPASAWRSASQD